MDALLTPSSMVVLFALPLLWSALVFLVRSASASQSGPVLAEWAERSLLLATVVPTVLGAMLLLTRQLVPEHVALLPTFPEIGGALPEISPSVGTDRSAHDSPWFPSVALVLYGVYLLGFAKNALRIVQTELRFQSVIRQARPWHDRRFSYLFVTDSRVSPFATSDGKIVLPTHILPQLRAEQVDAIIRHEQAHIERGDASYYRQLAWCAALFWWNPFVCRQVEQCRLCAEIACDEAAVALEHASRRALAESLLVVLKGLHEDSKAVSLIDALAIGRKQSLLRVRRVLEHAMPPSTSLSRRASLALLALFVPIAAVQAAYSSLLAVGAPHSAKPHAAERTFTIAPLAGSVSSPFGHRVDPRKGGRRFHFGVDIAARTGTPVRAPAPGRVARADADKVYGRVVEIDHGAGIVTRYAQLSHIDVTEGARLRPGDIVGRVGQSGAWATGPHLHLELFVEGKPIDPASSIPLPGPTPETGPK